MLHSWLASVGKKLQQLKATKFLYIDDTLSHAK